MAPGIHTSSPELQAVSDSVTEMKNGAPKRTSAISSTYASASATSLSSSEDLVASYTVHTRRASSSASFASSSPHERDVETSPPSSSAADAFTDGNSSSAQDAATDPAFWDKRMQSRCHFPCITATTSNSHQQHTTPSAQQLVQSIDVTASCLVGLRDTSSAVPILQAAWGVVLQGYTLMEHVTFGYVPAEATGFQTEDTTLLPCSIDYSKVVTFSDLVDLLAEEETLARRHVSEYRHSDTLSYNTAIDFTCGPTGVTNHSINKLLDKSGIILGVDLNKETPGLSIYHSSSILSAAAASRLARSLEKTLEAIIAAPNTTAATFQIVHDKDVNLSAYRNVPALTHSCTHWVIADQIADHPDSDVVISGRTSLTYRQLGELSWQLANKLQSAGVTPQSYVGVCFQKSILPVISMVAIQIIGAAFVPLDPTAPPARWQSILEAVDAKLVLCSSEMEDQLRSSNVGEVMVLGDSDLKQQKPEETTGNLSKWKSTPVSPSDPSFVIFTSGSTGKPKGIIMQHGPTCSTSNGYAQELDIGPGSRVYQFSAYTFDMGVLDILATLMRGGCICIPTEHERWNDLAGSMTRLKANTAFLTPTVANLLYPQDVPHLKHLILAGETISQTLAARWREQGVRLHGLYGPTETSVCGLSDNPVTDKQHKVGTPSSCAFWVIDAANPTRLVPDGCIGELLVQGPILAQGYFSASEQAMSNWVTDARGLPQGVPVAKAYRTGDLVRKCPDGTYDYLGRKDSQVKIRGQRIELGEIEVQLSLALPRNLSGFVEVLRGEERSQDSIACFIWYVSGPQAEAPVVALASELSQEEKSLVGEVEAALKAVLSSYMIPSTYFFFGGTPDKTHSGKVDRKKLLALGEEATPAQRRVFSPSQSATQNHEAPTTDMELKLRELWASVLKTLAEDIGKNDSFFSLGGDSMSAIRLVSDADRSGISITVAAIFSHPRLEDMALAASTHLGFETLDVEPFSLLSHVHLEKRTVLEQVRQQCGLPTTEDIQDVYPCSPFQEGLMAVSTRKPGAYVEKLVYSLAKGVDVSHFKAAWDKTVRFVDILRTRIVLVDGRVPLQAVMQTSSGWSEFPTLYSAMESFGKQSFSYGSQLGYWAVVEEADRSNSFIWAIHHALHDAWTLRNIFKLLKTLYWGEQTPSQQEYTMFVKYLTTIRSDEARTFWEGKLNGAQRSAFPVLTYDSKPSEARQHFRTRIDLPASADFSTSVTKASVLRAAWALILSRYCEADDVCFGLTVSGRQAPLAQADQVVGAMLTTMPARTRMDKSSSVEQYLQAVQSDTVEMIPYEQFGLQNIAKIGTAMSEACRFSNLLVVQPADVLNVDDGSEKGSLLTAKEGQENLAMDHLEYPLVLQALMSGEAIDLVFAYDPSYLVDSQCLAVAKQLEHVAVELLKRPTDAVDSVTVSGPWDMEQAIEWNGPKTLTAEECLHDVISVACQQRGDQEALYTTDGSCVSYRQLDELASLLARHLLSLGLSKGSIVPICFKSSVWAPIAMLGVLKAGCAFVPLDPAHPEQRRKTLVEQVGASVVITSDDFASSCDNLGVEMIQLSHAFFETQRKRLLTNQHEPLPTTSPADTAYILFTSGSTGKPKGVVVQHQAVCTSICSYRTKYAVQDSIRSLQFSSYAFDASIYEIFMTLASSGTVCIPSVSDRLQNTSRFITEAKVNFAMLTPSFVRTLQPDRVPTLSTLMLIGEAPSLDVIEEWRDRLCLMNGYGPTECCVLSDTNVYSPGENLYKASTVIGQSLHGSSWIVEPDNMDIITPIGCVGELIIQSPALAQGYYSEPEKTSAFFVDGVKWEGTPRAYKTGDLVRYRHNGKIEYIGRKDNQVKLRGQRLELGEIEHAIQTASDKVRQTTVHLTKRSTGEFLLAFVEMKQDSKANLSLSSTENLLEMDEILQETFSALTSSLKTTLPSYMVPSFLLPIKEMPLGSTTKADRQYLQRLADSLALEDLSKYSSSPGSNSEKVEPVTEKEFLLRDLWAQVLRLKPEDIGREDSFLHIGGDSINAIHLSVLARKHSLEIPVSVIFEDSRLSYMAQAAVDCADSDEAVQNTTPEPFSLLQTDDTTETVSQLRESCLLSEGEIVQDAYPCTPLQEGLLALSVKYRGSYVAKHVYRLGDNTDLDRFRAAWEHVYNVCDNQRLRIVKQGQESVQVLVGGDFAWEETKGFTLTEYLDYTGKSIRMSYGDKLTRSAIVNDPSGRRYFVWVNHHAIFDGWTISLILTALRKVYKGTDLDPFVPYAGFIKYAGQLDKERAREYWMDQLKGGRQSDFPPSKPIVDRSTTPNKKVIGIVSRDIDFVATGKTSITKGTILRAAWAVVLARYGNTDDICFGATASGRNAPVSGITTMAGTVIGTVPIRIKVGADTPVTTFLRKVQNQALGMVPFEQSGLQNILRINDETRQVGDFTSLLIVQPEEQVDLMSNVASEIMAKPSSEEYSFVDTMDGYFTFPIVIQCYIYKNKVTVELTYDNTVVSDTQMSVMCRHYENVAQVLLAQDDRKLSDITLAGDWDLQRAIQFNEHAKETVVDSCLHDIIGKWAVDNPNHEAVYTTDRSITYSELDHLSSLLASHLVQQGVTLETVVPICVDKSIWAPIAMLGIIKAGGVFMPMEPSHPYARRRALIEEVKARHIITSTEFSSSCVDITDKVIELSDAFFARLADATSYLDAPRPSPTNTAYILFTSGSTGKPKGIAVQHTAIASSIASHGVEFQLSPSSRVLQFASYVFDVSVSEVLTTLCFGATVCIPTPTERLGDITGFINRSRTDVAMLTPSFVSTFSPEQTPGLKTLILGGEAPTKSTLDVWQPHLRLLNGYAPAECCIYALTHTYESLDEVPTVLGKGLHSNCWVVDPQNPHKLAPIGCVGELVIQSNAIGRGYIGDEARTKQVFLEELDWVPQEMRKPHYRFYLSGDLVRYDDKGELEYLGRKDTQVKLRGQRIELGEIEYAVEHTLPGVQYVAVEVIRKSSREALIVFVSFASSTDTPATDSRSGLVLDMTPALASQFRQLVQDLRAKLPPYMVPGLFLPLKHMPFLSSMKIDRKTLRSVVDQLTTKEFSMLSLTEEKKEPPATDMEFKLRDLWAKVLKIDQQEIGKNNSFFQLGGDSIAAVELLHLAQTHGVGLNIMQMFRDSSLATMAASATVIQDTPGSGAITPSILLRQDQISAMQQDACRQCNLPSVDSIEDIFPCTSMQEALLAISLKLPGAYMSTSVYRVSPKVQLDRFKDAWIKTVWACSNLRTRFIADSHSSSAKPYQVIIKDVPDWDDTEGETLKSYFSRPGLREIGYGSRLCRYGLLTDETTGETLFALTIHHSIYDLWTIQLVVKVFNNMYRGIETSLRPYRDFVQYTIDQNSASSRKWWKDQLRGAKRAQYPRPPLPGTKKTERVTRTMKARIDFPDRVRSHLTTATLVRAAWAIILSKYCDTTDVCFGASVSGRLAPLPGITEMPGPSIATVPVRIKLNAAQPVSEFLDAVQELSTAMIPHEQFGIQNMSQLSADAKDACELSNLLIIQPVQQVVALLGGKPADGFDIIEEDEREETETLADSQLQEYFDDCALVMNCLMSDTGIDLLAYYEVGRVSERELEAMEHHMGHVIHQLLTRNDDPVGSISLVDEWDAEQALTKQPSLKASGLCVHELVSSQIEQHPEVVAVDAWDGKFTYAELGALAAALSQKLTGFSPRAIPLYMGRSKWEVVAILATQITGHGFLTIPPGTPESQVRMLLESSQAEIVLTTSDVQSHLPSSKISTIVVDQETIVEDGPLSLPRLGVESHATSHLLYSAQNEAARPVVIKHEAACISAETAANALGIQPGSRVFHISETSGYMGVAEVLTALSKGATLCIPSDDMLDSDLSQAINVSSAEIALLSPLAIDLASLNPKTSSLKTVALGGDVIHRRQVEAWLGAGIQVHTFYGTNESSICAWKSVFQPSEPSTQMTSSSGATFVVLEPEKETLTPLGCVGELSIEGPVAAGRYLNGDMTSSIYHLGKPPRRSSFSGTNARTAFRTGDVVRRNHDGTFDFIGRKADRLGQDELRLDYVDLEARLQHVLPDHISAIVARLPAGEAASTSSPIASTAIVLLLKEQEGQPRKPLTLAEEQSNEIDDLIIKANSSLKLDLPNYAVPTSYLVFRGTPRARLSGRTFRQAIIDAANSIPTKQRRLVHMIRRRKEPPSTPTEETIRDLWAAVLSVPAHEIGRHDSFIHHGGNSVSAIQIVSLAHRRGLVLTVASIFRNPRLCDLAASATSTKQGGSDSSVTIKPFSLLDSGKPGSITLEEVKKQCGLAQSDSIQDMYPCTPLQEGLWALSIKNKGAYIAHYTFEFGTNLDIERFKLAWERVIEMCSILRTRIVLVDGTHAQVVVKSDAHWEQVEDGATVSTYLGRAFEFPIDYGSRLSRFALIGQKHFVWTVHHSIFDGWTKTLILERLNQVYKGVSPPKEVPFTTFIKHIKETDPSASQNFWSQQLEGAKRTVFPSGSLEAHKPTAIYHQPIKFNSPPTLAFTKATVLQTAWAVLLAHYCETSDICFGTTVTGRQAALPQIADVVGPTIASVPYRFRLDYDSKVEDVLAQMQEQSMEIDQHNQYGLQNIAKLSKEAGEACDFTSLFTVQPSQFSPDKDSDDVLSECMLDEAEEMEAGDSTYFTTPLVFVVNMTGSSDVSVDVSYAPDLLTELRVRAMVAHLENIADQLMKLGDKPLSDVSVSGEWDLERAVSWNQQEDISEYNVCVHNLLAKRVSETPDHEAIYSTGRSLTYAEFDRLTTQLAVFLRQQGVGPEVIVPYCYEKSVYAVISVWAIVKAGGAFMPMDPSHPTEYRQRLVQQVNAKVMLVSPNTAAKCEGMSSNIITVSESSHCFQLESPDTSVLDALPAKPNNPVYIIFSSGSTGVPKGIVVEHKSYAASLRGQRVHFGMGPKTRFIQFSNHVFDVACMEMLTTLCCGGTLCVPTEVERLEHTARFLTESGTTSILTTPSFLRSLEPDQVPTLKRLLVGGEAMTDDLVRTWAAKTVLINAYGPAEASVVSATHTYRSPNEPGSSIGGPMSTRNWVVDQHHPDRLAAIGCVGELVLQGPSITRGYINDPERTRNSFFSSVDFLPQKLIDKYPRFYKTGDLVCHRSDGVLTYVGRVDTQVKIRGQRMELGDIETKILRVGTGVDHAVVDVIRQQGLEALVAFISLKEDHLATAVSQSMIMPGTDAMQEFSSAVSAGLSKLVPGHMLPTYYLPVAQMPRTSSGKIDRRALKTEAGKLTQEELLQYAASHRAKFRDCSNETETRVRSLWAKVLRMKEENISVDDNFYDLGGDSITIVTLMKHLQMDLGFHLSLSVMNSRSTTISIIAKLISDGQTVPKQTVDLASEIEDALGSMWIESIHEEGFQPVTNMSEDSTVFLTGATGFLGTQILRQLLASPKVKRVVTLVRASSSEQGLERLRRTATIAGWWYEGAAKRIETWTGDLGKKRLGLGEEQWERLCGSHGGDDNIDCIIHNGAVVNWNADYDKLREPNVQSVFELLKATIKSPQTPKFVFISGGTSTDPTADRKTASQEMAEDLGYSQTKFVSESVVYAIASQLPANQNRFSVVKPGLIIGTAEEGVSNTDDFLWRLVAAASLLNACPTETAETWMPVCDVGAVASEIIGQLTCDAAINPFFDTADTHGMPTSEFWSIVAGELDQDCGLTPWNEWVQSAREDMDRAGESHPLWPVQHFLAEGGSVGSPKQLAGPGQEFLAAAVKKNMQYLKSVGFIGGNDTSVKMDVIRRGL